MDNSNVRLAVHFLALLLTGLIAGAGLAVWLGYDPRGFNSTVFLAVHQGAVRGLTTPMLLLSLGSLLFIAVSAWSVRKERLALGLLVLAFVCLVAACVITAVHNQPINDQVAGWTAARVPRNWTALRETWWYWHGVRTALALASFALAIVGVFWSRASGRT